MGNIVEVTHKGPKIRERQKRKELVEKLKFLSSEGSTPVTKRSRVAHRSCQSSWIDSGRYPPLCPPRGPYGIDLTQPHLDEEDLHFEQFAKCPVCGESSTILRFFPDNFRGRLDARAHLGIWYDAVIVAILITVTAISLASFFGYLYNRSF